MVVDVGAVGSLEGVEEAVDLLGEITGPVFAVYTMPLSPSTQVEISTNLAK